VHPTTPKKWSEGGRPRERRPGEKGGEEKRGLFFGPSKKKVKDVRKQTWTKGRYTAQNCVGRGQRGGGTSPKRSKDELRG